MLTPDTTPAPGEATLARRAERRPRQWWLLALGVAAAAVYAIAFTWGIPRATNALAVHGWDVDGVGGLNVFAELSNLLHPRPDWYVAYPLFHYLLLAAVYAPYTLYLMATGGLAHPGPVYPYGFSDPVSALRTFELLARLVSLAMAAGAVVLAARVAARLWGRTAGVIAGLAVLVLGPMVLYARSSNLDIPVEFWTLLGVLVAARGMEEGFTRRSALLLGALAAIAVATKDQAYGAWVAGLAYVCWAGRPAAGAGDEPRGGRLRVIVPLILGGAITYAVANGIVIRPGRFIRHARFLLGFRQNFFNLQHANQLSALRPATAGGFALLLGDLLGAVVEAMGPLLLALGVAGLVLLARRGRSARLLAIMLAGFVVLTILPVRHMQYRYALFPASVLALFAGGLSADWIRRGGALRVAAIAALALGLGWQAVKDTDLTWQMLNDARGPAGAWLQRHARPGDRVAFFGASHQLPGMPDGVVPVSFMSGDAGEIARRIAESRPRFLLVIPDYFSDASRVRSEFLPAGLYRRIADGALGYHRVAFFPARTLLGSPLKYLPYVNPQVQIFERDPGPAPGRAQRPGGAATTP